MRAARPTVMLVLALASTAFAGCLTNGIGAGNGGGFATGADSPLSFTPLAVIDEERSGGEPVIAITPSGVILVSAHPGWTHTRSPPSQNLLTPNEYQSYMWRSVDNGDSWEVVEPAAGLPKGPKGAWAGVSDPDFAVDANGRVYFTDLGPLTHTAVVWSDDDGETWNPGTPVNVGPVDRQWLATHGTDVYFSANYFTEVRVLKSTDGGSTWTRVGRAPCNGDNSVDQADGTLYIGCGNGIAVSTDGGVTFDRRTVPGSSSRNLIDPEPAIDAAGNVYTAWSTHDAVYLAASSDKGATWTAPVRVSDAVGTPGATHVWPWVVAGDEGRAAVVWFGTPAGGPSTSTSGEWFVYQATVLDAFDTPTVHGAQATDRPIHVGPICQSGTTCQANQGPQGDRRLGDFFEAAVDADGFVHVVFSTTTEVPDSISHAGYVKQVAGPRLTG